MKATPFCLLASLVSGLLLVFSASAENWSQFRGPNGQGIGEAAGLPAQWSDDNIDWKIELPGKGHSSPVVWEDKVFITCADEEASTFTLLCVRASDGIGHIVVPREQDSRQPGL